MTVTPPSAGDPYRVPSAPLAYAGPPPSVARPSWVAWTALGLSALSFLITTSIGIIYAANSLSSSDGSEAGGLYYDAGTPSWGSVELTETGDVEAFTLQDSVDTYLKEGIEDVDGSADDVSDVVCEAIVQPKKNSVGTCSVVVQGVDSTVVLFFLNDQGAYLATLY